MAILDAIAPAPRRELKIFLVVDASERIGSPLAGLNHYALEECIRSIKKNRVDSDDYEMQIAILQFGACSWITSEVGPVSIDEIDVIDMPKSGMKGLKNALQNLDQKLSRNAFLNSQYGIYTPVIIFIGSGNSAEDIESEIACIRQNNWFKHALKLAVKTDVHASNEVFNKITGNPETVISIDSISSVDMLCRMFARDSFVS